MAHILFLCLQYILQLLSVFAIYMRYFNYQNTKNTIWCAYWNIDLLPNSTANAI